MRKQIIACAAAAGLMTSMLLTTAAAAVHTSTIEEYRAIKISSEQLKAAVIVSDELPNEMIVQDDESDNYRASFYEYGSDYAYNVMGTMDNAENMRRHAIMS